MAILLDEKTKVIVQGFTGQIGTFHATEMIEYGTNVVGGVTPGKGGTKHLDRPVFNTMKEAVEVTGANASIIFIPAPFAADGIMEAADSGIRYCVCITDGIPAHDMIRVKRYMRRYRADQKMVLTGPNCAGTISPGKEADIVMIRADDINLYPSNNALGTVVQAADRSNVDTVIIGGKIVKYRGQLAAVDMPKLKRMVDESRRYLFRATNYKENLFAEKLPKLY